MEQCWDAHSPWQPHSSTTSYCQTKDFKRQLRKHTVSERWCARSAGEEGELLPCYCQLTNEASWMPVSEEIICPPASGSKKWKAAGTGHMHKEVSLLCLCLAFHQHSLKFVRSESMAIYWISLWVCFPFFNQWELKRCIIFLFGSPEYYVFPVGTFQLQMLKPKI